MRLQIFLLYLATWSLIAVTPGPAVMCAMAQASRYGFRSSFAGITGIQFGNLLFFIWIALGLAALLEAATSAFTVLRMVGAAYLFYLGLRIIIASFLRPSVQAAPSTLAPPAQRSLFLQGLLIQLTNPRHCFLFPRSCRNSSSRAVPVLFQLVILGIATILIDTVVLSFYAFFAGRGVQAFRASQVGPWLERTLGAALVFFGFRLLFTRK
jgi:threonine/homoserine/homoserine lactone efflux protein